MICHDCGRDDKEVLSDDLPVAEVVRLCKEWKCKLCRRTQEEVQADFDTEAMRNPHKSAHDWGSIKVPNAEFRPRRFAASSLERRVRFRFRTTKYFHFPLDNV